MSLIVVVGGQYGSEGKGKVTSHLALRDNVELVVRCGGPNSGHTVDLRGRRYELRCLPAGFVNPGSRLLLASGAIVNPEVLLGEVKATWIDPRRVGIDFNTGVASFEEIDEERRLFLRERVGSTLSGTGIAVANRALRVPAFRTARAVPELRGFLTDVSSEVNRVLDRGGSVIIEGTQGFGLSVYHSKDYPFATSRDTTAAGFLSEVGVSPRLVTDIILAIRTYPIRVAGNSGPLLNEISWEEVREKSGYPGDVREFTTTTKRLRRVAKFSYDVVRTATAVNRPTQIALHGADYLSYSNKGLTSFSALTEATLRFVRELEEELEVPVKLIGTGPTNEEIVDRSI